MEADRVTAELSINCIGCDKSQSKYVAAIQEILHSHHLKTELHAMGTDVEGPLSEILAAVAECREVCHHEMDIPRVEMHLKISSRIDKPISLEERVRRVHEEEQKSSKSTT